MPYIYFYVSIALTCIVLFVLNHFRPMKFRHIVIGITTIAYSLVFEMLLGNWLGLYYYLDKDNTALYMVLSGVFIYPVLNMIYVLLLPNGQKAFLIYTGAWIAGMLLIEFLTAEAKIVVFTGWKPIPWSLFTYALTYLWVNLFYRYLQRRDAVAG